MCSGPAVTCRSIYDSGLHIALHAHAHAHAHAYRDTSPDVLGFGTCGACAGPSSRDSQERVERETQVLTMATLTMNGTKREWSAGRSSSSDSVSRWRAPGWVGEELGLGLGLGSGGVAPLVGVRRVRG